MQAYILPLHTPSNPRWGQNIKTFLLKVVMLHINLMGIN